jgi:hypothetical protein
MARRVDKHINVPEQACNLENQPFDLAGICRIGSNEYDAHARLGSFYFPPC